MAGIGSNLAGYFGVYHRTVATRLKKAVGASPRELEALTSELKVSNCIMTAVAPLRATLCMCLPDGESAAYAQVHNSLASLTCSEDETGPVLLQTCP